VGRRIRHLLLLVLATGVGVALGTSAAGSHHPAVQVVAMIGPGQEAILMRYPGGRAHPEGPDPEDGPSKPPGLWASGASSLWTGGGRHPVWRGCQHVYDPTLSKFIFSSGGARASAPH
jgi:hypothetical protein